MNTILVLYVDTNMESKNIQAATIRFNSLIDVLNIPSIIIPTLGNTKIEVLQFEDCNLNDVNED